MSSKSPHQIEGQTSFDLPDSDPQQPDVPVSETATPEVLSGIGNTAIPTGTPPSEAESQVVEGVQPAEVPALEDDYDRADRQGQGNGTIYRNQANRQARTTTGLNDDRAPSPDKKPNQPRNGRGPNGGVNGKKRKPRTHREMRIADEPPKHIRDQVKKYRGY